MRFKKIICLLTASLMLTSTVAFGEALRYDYKRMTEAVSNKQANDIVYEDFTSVSPGMLPAAMNVTKSYGFGTTEMHEVKAGVQKNCFRFTDSTHDKEYTGPTATFSTGSQTGLLGVEVRYKYIPEETSTYSTFGIQLNGTQGLISKTVVISADGSTNLNYGGLGDTILEKGRITNNAWYTLKYVVDFDNQVMDVMLKNETTGFVNQIIGNSFIEQSTFDNLTNVKFTSSVYGGTWMVDYIRVSREKERMPEYENLNIKKGVPAELVDGPVSHKLDGKINVNINGIYKATTQKPYLSGNGEVMVYAKNVASMFKMGYYLNGNEVTIRNTKNTFTFAEGSDSAKFGGNVITLSEKCEVKDGKLFVSISDIAKALGYNASYDAENETLLITNGQ